MKSVRTLLVAFLLVFPGVSAQAQSTAAHPATGVVKSVDRAKSTVTLAHDPVKSLNWPAMTMPFTVKDKALLEKLPAGKKVQFEFVQQGKDYVITNVK
jgi:Cu(I)/Ag(I) efflux system protein CusF